MRRVGQVRKRDWNEASVISALQQIGVTCIRLSAPGVPDLLCYSKHDGYRLLEVKQPRGRLTPLQSELRARLPFHVVRSIAEALALYGVTSS